MKTRELALISLFVIFAVSPAISSPNLHSVFNDTYYCGFDWDADGNTTNDADDIVLCLDAAKEKAGNHEDGSDSSVIVQLPAGVFDICAATTCPYRLQGGLSIRGTNARVQADPTIKPTAAMRINGGTWLRGTTTETIFYGEDVFNLEIQDLGFVRFKVALHFGGDDIMGASWSRFENLFFKAECIGACDSTAMLFYNGLKNVIDGVFGRSLTRGLRVIAQNDLVQPSNLVVSSAVFACVLDEPNQGCIEVTLEPGAETGCSQSQNYVTFVRPQVAVQTTLAEPPARISGMRFANHPSCFATQNISYMTVIGADIEGADAECSFDLIDVAASRFELAGGNPSGTQYEFCVDSNSKYNMLMSPYDRSRARLDDTTSMLFGQFRSVRKSNGDPAVFGGIVQDTTHQRQSVVLDGHPLWWESETGSWTVADSFPPEEDGSNSEVLFTTTPAEEISLAASEGGTDVLPEHWHVALGADSAMGNEVSWSPDAEQAGAVLFFPLHVDQPTEFDQIGIGVQSPGVTGERIRLGLYSGLPRYGAVPGKLVFTSGLVAPNAVGDLTVPLDLDLEAGWYFLAVQFDSAPSATYVAREGGGNCALGRLSLSDAASCTVALRRPFNFDLGLPSRAGINVENVAGPVVTLGLRAR